ncbi:MAG: prepilin-type N-terminal cleavage/methylation domain-containing protein [Armatimonadetes bacterium]|nr:prepilin-type N-terminal cleavage/methylation domain-containing protein [Armatimonadota bacterium]
MLRRSGFTLVELLVVIAIMAVLAGILFPVFIGIRKKAWQAACASNLRQIGGALQMYEQDYDETTPNQVYDRSLAVNGLGQTHYQGRPVYAGWSGTPAHQLDPYLKVSRVWICPAKRLGGDDPSLTGALSYVFNYLGVFSDDSTDTVVNGVRVGGGRALASIQSPAHTVAVADGGAAISAPTRTESGVCGWWLDSWWRQNSFPNVAADGGSNCRFQTQRGKHGETANVLFADGHVESLRPSRLLWGENFLGQDGDGPDSPVASPEMDGEEAR